MIQKITPIHHLGYMFDFNCLHIILLEDFLHILFSGLSDPAGTSPREPTSSIL